MKRFMQCMSVFLIAVIVLATPVFAAETTAERSSYYFAEYCVYLWEPTDEAWFEVTAVSQMDELGASTIKIERSTDQVNWTTVKTFEKEDYSQMTSEKEVTYANCVPYTFTNGYYYRGIVTLYAKKGNGTGEMTVVTPTLNKR